MAQVKLEDAYDYAFIGLGAANCLLLLNLHRNELLVGKKIAIIEPSSKTKNDRTFCFWASEKEVLKLGLEDLISKSWDNVEITGITKQSIQPLQYHHIKGIDLYNASKLAIKTYHVTFFSNTFQDSPIVTSEFFKLELETQTIKAAQVFDSRPPSFQKAQKHQSHIYQSFIGWKIKTREQKFDPKTVVMMDFNIPQNDFTQFVYVLPFDENTALIELTRFGANILEKDEANIILSAFIKNLAEDYDILEYEQGVIPMSSAKLKTENFGKNWINMGSRADILKASTGYAFHSMANDALFQMESIKKGDKKARPSSKNRFQFYDRLLLKILDKKPQFGKNIFEILFAKTTVKKVLRFLNEETSPIEEISIFSKLPKKLFIQTALENLFSVGFKFPKLFLPFGFTFLAILLSYFNFEFISWFVLISGFFSVGLAHGALDHLSTKKIYNRKQLLAFSAKYVVKSILFGLLWLLSSDTALVLFIFYSAWHFGEADFTEWKYKVGITSFLWGMAVLTIILFFHFNDFILILKQIPNLKYIIRIEFINAQSVSKIQIFTLSSVLLLALIKKSKFIFLTIVYLAFSSMLPLLLSFGIYFVGQHSMNGWRHLSKELKETPAKMWLNALPFSAGGALIIIYFLLFAKTQYLGFFFIILSCLSFPHVFYMNRFYRQQKSQILRTN